MKNIIALLVALFATYHLSAQTTKDIYNPKVPLTWLGVDFTQLKVIKDEGIEGDKTTASEITTKYMPGWNELFLTEPKKYNVASSVDRSKVNYAIDVTKDANAKVNDASLFSFKATDYQLLDKDKIAQLVASYDFKDQKGLGMMIFMEGIDKMREEGSGWITFVNMDEHKLIFTKQFTGKSGGFGFRNYWAKSIYEMLKKFSMSYNGLKGKDVLEKP